MPGRSSAPVRVISTRRLPSARHTARPSPIQRCDDRRIGSSAPNRSSASSPSLNISVRRGAGPVAGSVEHAVGHGTVPVAASPRPAPGRPRLRLPAGHGRRDAMVEARAVRRIRRRSCRPGAFRRRRGERHARVDLRDDDPPRARADSMAAGRMFTSMPSETVPSRGGLTFTSTTSGCVAVFSNCGTRLSRAGR